MVVPAPSLMIRESMSWSARACRGAPVASPRPPTVRRTQPGPGPPPRGHPRRLGHPRGPGAAAGYRWDGGGRAGVVETRGPIDGEQLVEGRRVEGHEHHGTAQSDEEQLAAVRSSRGGQPGEGADEAGVDVVEGRQVHSQLSDATGQKTLGRPAQRGCGQVIPEATDLRVTSAGVVMAQRRPCNRGSRPRRGRGAPSMRGPATLWGRPVLPGGRTTEVRQP
jgi:hypothetical protein